MSVQVRRRREASAFLSSFVGAQGELIVDTTNNRVQVHDGATPGGWPAARLADVAARTSVADAAYTVLTSDRTVAFTALTAARVVTLPAASAFPTGTQLLIVDESGGCSATNTITLTRAGSDTINGATSAVLALPWGYLALVGNGVSKWTIIDQSTASMAQQAASNVAITGGTMNGTAIGGTTRAVGSFSAVATGFSGTPPVDAYFYKSTTATVTSRFQNANGTADYAFDGTSVYFTNYSTGDVAFAASGSSGNITLYAGGAERFRANATNAVLSVPLKMASYTVATLPAGASGQMAFASNGRKSGEAAGAGTGVTVAYSNGAWRRLSDETAVAA